MSFASTIGQLRERALAYWVARTDQERTFLGAGAAVALLALVYLLFVSPALDGRAQLRRSLPQLRQQAAELQTLAQEATALNSTPVPQVAPMTREALAASLSARGLSPQSLSLSGQYAKLQLNGVSFANLVTWLDAQRRENRIAVQDAVVTALATAGQVDASLTLRQNNGAGGAAAR
ncbi:MAG: type II secretion system protein GspM [Massilia sp.]